MESVFCKQSREGKVAELLKTKLEDKLLGKYGSTTEERIKTILSLSGAGILNAIKKDLSNRYALLEDWLLPPVAIELPEYDDGYISITPLGDGNSMILIYAYGGDCCDGCSCAPDNVKGGIQGALFHDMWYLRMDYIAEAWGWKVSKVRKIGDRIFASIMLEEGSGSFIASTYYHAVRIFGGLFHKIMKIKFVNKIIEVISIAVILCVFSGCVKTVFNTDMMQYESPVWENVTEAE